MDTADKLSRWAAHNNKEISFIGVPKTIDNDIYGTDMTFGFYSAVNIASDAIDCIHTTASSHQRVFIVEVMGHKVGLADAVRRNRKRRRRYPDSGNSIRY